MRGTTERGSMQVQAVPVVAVAPADAMQVGTGALRSPQERPVVRELFGA